MEILIWIGAAISLIGLAGLVWSIIRVMRARKTTTTDEELKAEIQAAMPINMGALAVSTIGLMLVIVGISLS